jgi:hypothetical protein
MIWNSLIALWMTVASPMTVEASPQPVVVQAHPASRPGVTYAYSVVDPREFKLSVKAFAHATQIIDIPESIACSGVAITGGFSRRSNSALKAEGLIRTGDRTLSSLASWRDGGVLSIVGDRARIIRISAWRASPSSAGMALQTRPLLVFDGRLDEPLNDRSHWNRVAVGTMRDGSVVLIGAFAPHNRGVTLKEFAKDAMATLGPDLVSLLNLDGGPSAFLTSRDVHMFPSPGAVTTYLCAERADGR